MKGFSGQFMPMRYWGTIKWTQQIYCSALNLWGGLITSRDVDDAEHKTWPLTPLCFHSDSAGLKQESAIHTEKWHHGKSEEHRILERRHVADAEIQLRTWAPVYAFRHTQTSVKKQTQAGMQRHRETGRQWKGRPGNYMVLPAIYTVLRYWALKFLSSKVQLIGFITSWKLEFDPNVKLFKFLTQHTWRIVSTAFICM